MLVKVSAELTLGKFSAHADCTKKTTEVRKGVYECDLFTNHMPTPHRETLAYDDYDFSTRGFVTMIDHRGTSIKGHLSISSADKGFGTYHAFISKNVNAFPYFNEQRMVTGYMLTAENGKPYLCNPEPYEEES